MKHLFALLTGLVFGTGIAISGMMDPAKVLNFFDLFGTWDPSLMFVMGGALIVTLIGYRLVWRRAGSSVRTKLPGAELNSNRRPTDWWLCAVWYWLGHCRVLPRCSDPRSWHGPMGSCPVPRFRDSRFLCAPASQSSAGESAHLKLSFRGNNMTHPVNK